MACNPKIRRDIEAALARALGRAAQGVRVRLEADVLTLEGELESRILRSLAEQAVRELPGVRALRNRIEVVSPVRLGEVRRRIRAAFARDAAARGYHVEAAVDGAVVSLKGQVASWAERQAAERAAAAAPGVLEVRNELVVEPWPFAPVIMG
jgi:osmotically-inducible protein OsmY